MTTPRKPAWQGRRAGTTTQRGYGYHHQKLRLAWARRVAHGQVNCARCGEPIQPGTPWELGHVDEDRTKYRGPEHAKCNQDAGRQLGQARRVRVRRTPEPHPGLKD